MGISKAMMERVAIAKSKTVDPNLTSIMVTRYGNVMGSRGSVIPLFVEQIKAHKNLTVTDPEMTRFIMSLEEAVELVIYAFEEGHSGDILIKKSPAAKIGLLARALIELFKSKSEIKIIGSRHAEKNYETLMTKEESLVANDLGSFYQIPADNRDLNYEKYFSEGISKRDSAKEYNSDNTKQLSIKELKEVLNELEFIKSSLNS